jgi:magnesium transporter
MFKTRYAMPGSAAAALLPLPTGCSVAPVIKLIEYDEHTITERVVTSVDELPAAFLDDGKGRWIDMEGLGDARLLKALAEKYQIHPLALEDVVSIGQRPKVEHYEHHLFIVAAMVYADESDRICGEQISFFLGKHLLITMQEAVGGDVFDPVRVRLRTGAGRGYIRKSRSDYLAYALLDAIIDHYYPVLERLGDAIEELEDEVLAKPGQECVSRIHHYKRTLMQLRRYVWPLRDIVTAMMHDESGIVQPNTKVFLRDCYDHTVQIMDLVETYRDVNSGLMDLYLSSVGMRTNEIMRVLTIMSSIFIPLTFIVGIYGMNFDNGDGSRPLNMPELYQPWGYPSVIALMAIIAIGQLIFFKRKKWL